MRYSKAKRSAGDCHQEIGYYLWFLRGVGTQCHGEPHEETPVSVMRQRGERGNCAKSLYCGFHKKVLARKISRPRTG